MGKKSQSIRSRLLLPIFAIMIVQCALFLGFIFLGGFVDSLKENSIDILNEKMENGKLYLEKEMIHRFINVLDNDETIISEIEITLARENKTASDIKNSPQLNKIILEDLTENMIDLLHRGYATGVFVILDGPAAERSVKDMKAGTYIRDLDTSSYAYDNSDLLLERGLSSISKSYGIPLDSYWDIGFLLEPDDLFFYNPFHLALNHYAKMEEISSYGYLSMPFSMHFPDTEVITYSLPLVTSSGDVVGVMGFDMTIAQVQSLLDYSELDDSGNAICFLGMRKSGTNIIEKAIAKGPMYDRYFSGKKEISYEKSEKSNINRTISEDKSSWYTSIKKLDIYNKNTPFETEEWVLVGMVRNHDLMSFYQQIQGMLLFALSISLLLSIVGMFIVSHVLTKPISNLIDELRNQPSSDHLSFKRLHIDEIDELTDSIEKLSADVAESASKISNILEHANVPIGVFEYKNKEEPIFCSRSLYQMLGWGTLKTAYIYLETEEFNRRMKELEKYRRKDNDAIYYFETPLPKWLKLTTVSQENESFLGVLSDVSDEMLDKIKLEKERDYDLLTNIYNRRAFREEVEKQISKMPEQEFAMVMWDLDNLKYINDTYGHDEGDRYIVLFAEKLHQLENGGGLISRYAGDEFITMVYDHQGKENVRKRIKAFMRYLQTQTMVAEGGYRMPIRVSAGIAWYPTDAVLFDHLITYADFAMYTVKHSVKGIVMEFDAKSYSNNAYMLAGREELNRLFELETVDFAYQPIVDRLGDVYGYELLMRPRLEKLKGIYEVLNLAKAQSKLLQMEFLTWKAALTSIAEQSRLGNLADKEKLFINSIASVRLSDEVLADLESQYREYLSRIVIEMTENEPIEKDCLNYKIETAKRWKAAVAIDDFGSGYNSETILLDMEPDIVKIDMALVRNIDKDKNRQFLLKSMIEFTKKKEIQILAEGVETAEELKILMEFGIDLFQGYYIGRPELEIRPIPLCVVEKMQFMAKDEKQ